MADDNRWSDRDRDWRDDRRSTEPGMGRDGRWESRHDPRFEGRSRAERPLERPGGRDFRPFVGEEGRYVGEEAYRASRYANEDWGGLGPYDEAGYHPRTIQGRGRPEYARGADTPAGAVAGGQDSSDYPRPGEHRSWAERTGEKLGHFVRDHSPGHDGGEHRGRGPRGYKRSDERIHEDVSDRLTEDGYLDASGIEVQVHEGEVTLNGTVPRREAKRRAEDLAEAASGVKHVQNNLRVNADTQNVDPIGAGVQATQTL
jgi:hypothetical protein